MVAKRARGKRGASNAKKAKPRTSRKGSRARLPPRPKLTVAELDRRLAIARKAAAKKKIDQSGEQQRLARALELLQLEAMDAGYNSVLRLAFPPIRNEGKWSSPWIIVGRFAWRDPRGFGYIELGAVIKRWKKRKLVARIGAQRLARMRVDYLTDRGQKSDYTLAETQPWAVCLEKALSECDPTNTETDRHGRIGSLASRYGIVRDRNGNMISGSEIESLYVWLSSEHGRDIFDLNKPKPRKRKRA